MTSTSPDPQHDILHNIFRAGGIVDVAAHEALQRCSVLVVQRPHQLLIHIGPRLPSPHIQRYAQPAQPGSPDRPLRYLAVGHSTSMEDFGPDVNRSVALSVFPGTRTRLGVD